MELKTQKYSLLKPVNFKSNIEVKSLIGSLAINS